MKKDRKELMLKLPDMLSNHERALNVEGATADSESKSSESSIPLTILTSATGSTSTTTLQQNLLL
jgi:hypothetical protein